MNQLTPMPAAEAGQIEELAAEARLALGVPDDAAPLAIATAIHERIDALRSRAFAPEEAEDLALQFGALWGEQVARESGWRWVFLEDGAAAVASPDGAHAAVPLADVYALVTDPAQVDSMLLLFNMIAAGSLGPAGDETIVIGGHYQG